MGRLSFKLSSWAILFVAWHVIACATSEPKPDIVNEENPLATPDDSTDINVTSPSDIPAHLLPSPSTDPALAQPPVLYKEKNKPCKNGFSAMQDDCTRCSCADGEWVCKSICPPTKPPPANRRKPSPTEQNWTVE